ncbi:MAG: hypothetical protein AB1374_06005 [Bacillota bacterium]
MISEATIATARLYPECLPDARVLNVGAGAEASPALLDLRRFRPKFLTLGAAALDQNAGARLRIRNDTDRLEMNCAGYPQNAAGEPYLTRWGLVGTELLQLNLYAAAALSNYRAFFNVWVYEPTVAHKLKHGKLLTPEEADLAERLGLRAAVEKGVLPLSIPYLIEREYQVLDETTYGQVVDVSTTEATVAEVPARPNELLVLTAFSSAPDAVANNIRIRIDRDDDPNYLEIPTFPLRLETDWPCFVPALHELRIKLIAANPVAAHPFRYTVRRCLLTNTLRVRFGLLRKEEAPGELWDKVKGGVL